MNKPRPSSLSLRPTPEKVENTRELRRDIFGWYGAEGKVEYEPPYHGPCIVCCLPLKDPIITQKIVEPVSKRCYFYKAHKGCWEAISSREKTLFDKCIVDINRKT